MTSTSVALPEDQMIDGVRRRILLAALLVETFATRSRQNLRVRYDFEYLFSQSETRSLIGLIVVTEKNIPPGGWLFSGVSSTVTLSHILST